MPTFSVELSALADMVGHVEVEADSEEQAEAKAIEIAKGGDVLWKYNGIHEENEGDDYQVESTVEQK